MKEEEFDWPIKNETQCIDLYGRYSLFEVVDQHLCGTQNLVQIGPGSFHSLRFLQALYSLLHIYLEFCFLLRNRIHFLLFNLKFFLGYFGDGLLFVPDSPNF